MAKNEFKSFTHRKRFEEMNSMRRSLGLTELNFYDYEKSQRVYYRNGGVISNEKRGSNRHYERARTCDETG